MALPIWLGACCPSWTPSVDSEAFIFFFVVWVGTAGLCVVLVDVVGPTGNDLGKAGQSVCCCPVSGSMMGTALGCQGIFAVVWVSQAAMVSVIR